MAASVSRVYANVNKELGEEWHDYAGFTVTWGSVDNYEVVKRVGKGKYSDVFEGIDVMREERCIIKVLKPVKKSKIKREIKILKNLVGGPNIVELFDVVRDPNSKVPSLVTEYVENIDFKTYLPHFTDLEIRFYMLELLKALDFCHSKGIIHRDVKPHNIMFDPKQRKIRLIDWGLAEFYHPGVELNVRVATRCYKGPELLVDYREYDYSLDVWCAGCVFATLLFIKEPFFYGRDNYDQLVKIAKVLGTAELFRYLDKYEIELESAFDGLIGSFPRKLWSSFMTQENVRRITPDALDLLSQLLKYDHQDRLTAAEAQTHKYFSSVKPTLEHINPSDDSGLDSY